MSLLYIVIIIFLCPCVYGHTCFRLMYFFLQVGRDGFAQRVPTKLFALDMEAIMTEMPVAAPYLLVKLMKQCLEKEVQ